jgi:hypothetical protein
MWPFGPPKTVFERERPFPHPPIHVLEREREEAEDEAA